MTLVSFLIPSNHLVAILFMTQFQEDLLFDHRAICEAIFNYSVEAIVIVDKKGVVIHANPTACTLFGYTIGELLGNRISILIPHQYRNTHEKHMDGYNDNPHARSMAAGSSLFGLKKNGTEFPINASLSPAKVNDTEVTIALVIDITEQKESKDKLKQLNIELELKVEERTRELALLVNKLENANSDLRTAQQEIEQALAKEKQLNELKSRFVSMASHEFRTPLSTILSSTSLLEKYGTSSEYEEKREKHYDRIKSNVRALTNILNDFLSLDKLQEGSTQCTYELFDLKKLAKNVIDEQEELKKPGQIFLFNYTGSEEVSLDINIIKNCLNNLLSNAIKYSSDKKNIHLNIYSSAKEVSIEVIDEGIGIPEEEQVHLFERFFRAKNVTNIQGTGLGLTIVKRYVELMKGTIDFTSEYMKGTTFTIKLPNKNG